MPDEPAIPDPIERSDRPPDLSSRDDARLLELLFGSPDRIHSQVVLWADGRVLPESDPGRRTVVGWHRAGGPVLLGVTTGVATDGLLLEAFHLAATETDAPIERWRNALATFWSDAAPDLRRRIAKRRELEGPMIESPEAWTSRAWDAEPAAGPARTGLVAARVPRALRRSIAWLADLGVEVAAWEISRAEASGGTAYRFEPVAGRWTGLPERPLPALEEERRRRTYVRHTGGVTAELLATLEAQCRASGAAVAWSGKDWVRFDGPRRSLRVFPGKEWIDLQFVGADEGTLIGLRFRYGVPVERQASTDAPPGVHLRLTRREDLGSEVRLLIKSWLGGRSDEAGEEEIAEVRRRGRGRDASDPERAPERGPRNRSR